MLFTRRRINIESITVSESEVTGVHRYTVVIATSHSQAQKITAQLLKLVDVLQVFMYEDEEIISQELALFKVRNLVSDNSGIRELLERYGVKVLEQQAEYKVLEMAGDPEKIKKLMSELEPYGLLEFSKSGSVALSRNMKELREYLREADNHNTANEEKVNYKP